MSNKVLLICVLLAVVTTLTHGLNIAPMVDVDFLDSLFKSSQNVRSDSQQNCFQIYTPKLTELSNTYKTEYNRCVTTATASNQAIIKEVAGNVASITQWRNEICSGYTNCQGSQPYPFFDCNKKVASESMTKSFNIQTMSKDRMQYVTLRTEMVEYDAKTCTDKCTNAYTVNSKNVYDQLQTCLSAEPTAVPQ